jgi:hypothetical protein
MTPQLMIQPSSFVRSGVQLSQLGEVYLFKFTDELQTRFEGLLSKNRQDALTSEERAELEGISELSRIFTLMNAQLAAPDAVARIKQFRGILQTPDDDRSLVDELIQERREEAARESLG